jgi:CRISPR/Cas system Type II protein with McrA/HNH and RuvC-like nuclease domain
MKTLNIYCGIRSIGWNVTDAGEVIDFGVKRVNVDFDSYYAFIAGLPVAKRIDRRMKRQARRNLWRWKTRREKLTKLLKTDGMMPEKEKMQWDRKTLNNWRDHVARYTLCDSKQLIGRVLLDLQTKRGYKSMRGVDDTGDSEYLKSIEMHENALKDYPTVGAYLNSLNSTKNVILRRETYEAEFYRICKVQGIDPERYYGAIFMQRPLKKGKIAFCRLEANRKVTHQSNPMYQKFRILRDAANIEIFDNENNLVEITDEHRKSFIRQLQSGKDLTKAGALKIMGIKKSANYTWYSGKAISGDIWGK